MPAVTTSLECDSARSASERRDHVLAEVGERVRRREVAEPRVDALDAPSASARSGRPARAPVPMTGPGPTEAAGRERGDRLAVAVAATRATICWIDTRASPTCGRSSSILSRWPTCTFHQSAKSRTRASVFGPMPPITIGIAAERARLLPRAVQLVVAAVVVDDLAGPQGPHDFQRLAQPIDAVARLDRTDAEGRELLGHRAPADAELEAAAGGVVDRHRLAGEHRRMAERVAEHERADPQALGVRGEPRRRDHRLEHRLVVRQRRGQVVHAGDPDEAGRFGGPGRATRSSNDSRICGRNRLNSIAAKPKG